jgi:hypothetical protein
METIPLALGQPVGDGRSEEGMPDPRTVDYTAIDVNISTAGFLSTPVPQLHYHGVFQEHTPMQLLLNCSIDYIMMEACSR